MHSKQTTPTPTPTPIPLTADDIADKIDQMVEKALEIHAALDANDFDEAQEHLNELGSELQILQQHITMNKEEDNG